jgi:hypothetical protein
MKGITKMIYDSVIDLGLVLLVLLAIVMLPIVAFLTRALIPVTFGALIVLFIVSCFSHRMQNWLYR